MWQVVLRENGEETAGDEHQTYFAAFSVYEKLAKKINAVDKEGKYLNPDARICIRKAN